MKPKFAFLLLIGAVATGFAVLTTYSLQEKGRFDSRPSHHNTQSKGHAEQNLSISTGNPNQTTPFSEISSTNPEDAIVRPGKSLINTINQMPSNGLQPLTQNQEYRLERFVNALAAQNQRINELETLADHEKPDAKWSPDTERLLRNAIMRHGSKFTALRASAPRCTRSVCRLVATGGHDSSIANADWQKLIGLVMAESWFPSHFMDASTTVQADPNGLLYVTYFVRLVP